MASKQGIPAFEEPIIHVKLQIPVKQLFYI
jgi:hypothetical protein